MFSADQNLTSRLQELAARACSTGIVTDIDGTICPIVPRPNEARVADDTRALLGDLAARFRVVALISGRSVDDMLAMVPLPDGVMIGNHGMEKLAGGVRRDAVEAAPYRPVMDRLAAELVGAVDGDVIVQPKGLSISLHYRLAADPDTARARLLAFVQPLLGEHGLRLQEGRLVMDLCPDVALDKGTALADLVAEADLTDVIVFGDDLTDVAAFDRLRELRRDGTVRGLSVAVASDETAPGIASSADYRVRASADVIAALDELRRAANSSASLS